MPPRSLLGWGMRVALALAIVWGGYWSTTRSLALSVFETDPDRALRLAPGDARMAAALSRQLLLTSPGPRGQRRAAGLAAQALERDPTAVQAAATLGILAEAGGHVAMARRRFAYADLLSRRDLVTRLWLIEDAVRRGSTREALHHYDIALRTADVAGVLFPVLSAASSDPKVATELVRVMSGQPAWAEAFTVYAAGHGRDPEGTMRLFRRLQAAHIPVAPAARTALVDSLIRDGRFDAAWDYYATQHPGADRRTSRPLEMAISDKPRSRLDWISSGAQDGISVTMPRAANGYLDYLIPPTASGQLVAQLQLLPPGSYRIEGRGRTGGQAGQPGPYWVLRCIPGYRELGRVDAPRPASGTARFAGDFTVPADCPAQLLAMIARAPDDPAGIAGRIDEVFLRPAAHAPQEALAD